jgi:hypothetical protein
MNRWAIVRRPYGTEYRCMHSFVPEYVRNEKDLWLGNRVHQTLHRELELRFSQMSRKRGTGTPRIYPAPLRVGRYQKDSQYA